MVKKIKLYAIGNEKDFNYYIFDKKREIHKILSKLFSEIFKLSWPLQEERPARNDKTIMVKIDIAKNKDFHKEVSRIRKSDSSRIDVFYGDKKMFIVIHCSEEMRQKFNNKLKKIATMPSKK